MKQLISAARVVAGDGPSGDAVLVSDGVVSAIGFAEDLRSEGVPEEHHAGATIVPGFRDAHMHPVPYAALLEGCSLKQAADIGDLQRRLREYAGTLGHDQPVVATRLDDETLAELRLPTRLDLDAAIPDRPVVIYRYCGHVAVANTQALTASDITASTPDPDGGSIDRDSDGQPTGVLRETAAGLLSGALARGGQMDPDTLLSALRKLAGVGITSIGAIIGYGERSFEDMDNELALWRSIAEDLPIRVHGFVIADTPDQVERAARAFEGAGPRLTWRGIKRFADGSLGGHTAAMHAPFSDVDTCGTLRLSEIDTIVSRTSTGMGGMVAIHAIGDLAVDGVLDIFEELIESGADPKALRMEHVSVISPSQIQRFADMGVVAAVQPAFLASESEWVADRVGARRTPWLYPLRSMLDAGIPLAGSSDCPVEPPQPLWGMAAAMDRYGVTNDERLTGSEALALFTTGAALALREPEPLAVGSPADLAVLDTDPTTATAEEIHASQVIETYVDGVAVEVDRTLPVWPDQHA